MLDVWDKLLLNADRGEVTMLVLLDLSAAFDTLNHKTLLSRLREVVGVSKESETWFESFLSDCTFCVTKDLVCSPFQSISCGVPQGASLSPTLFNVYVKPLSDVLQKLGVGYHTYTDDAQIVFKVEMEETNHLVNNTKLTYLLDTIKGWMHANQLSLNTEKTEIILFGSKQRLRKLENVSPPIYDGL